MYAKAFSEWKRLARELIKNPDTKIDKIRQDQKTLGIDDEDCVIKILQDWKLETGADATLQTLLDKLEKLKWKDCAGKASAKNMNGFLCRALGNCGHSGHVMPELN